MEGRAPSALPFAAQLGSLICAACLDSLAVCPLPFLEGAKSPEMLPSERLAVQLTPWFPVFLTLPSCHPTLSTA